MEVTAFSFERVRSYQKVIGGVGVMPIFGPASSGSHCASCCSILADNWIREVRKTSTSAGLARLMESASHDLGCRYYALIHHGDLLARGSQYIDIKDYPAAVAERLFGLKGYRRDPVIRGCIYADSAFIWSDLPKIINFDKKDRESLEFGARQGLNEGITIPCILLGDCMGSCTFAGMRNPEYADRYLGIAQMIGIFAFQAARRLVIGNPPAPPATPKIYPKIHDCIVLAGRGYSNKEIARALGITPRTVDGYLTEAYHLFEVHGRTELVVSAVLAGEIGLHELKPRQSG